ncbi:MAG: hypothetical protein IKR76_01875, partial [Ruminococcus sp.]|nr:hypothetical protein [Ruminococcus sp.]
AFLDDFHALNLTEPAKIARATDYIEADIELVQTLIDKGYTYETTDGIYFDASKFKTYADFDLTVHIDHGLFLRGLEQEEGAEHCKYRKHDTCCDTAAAADNYQ